MKKELPKAYEPQKYEDKIYQTWEESGFFNPNNLPDTKGIYCNILPPPNSNGELHIGHVSGYVVMDLIGRYQRMQGKKVLLLPGKDHAGIQTQVVYEKKIKKEKHISRHDLGREKFYKEIYDFCIDRADYMRNQEKKIGLSADWSREKFTLDPDIIKVVLETFVNMYNEVDEKGQRMIYRGERIINWCPRCGSALADVEVEHEEQLAKLYYFKYSKDFPITIATTRPETKLGDTAVAINPKDERYKKYIGKVYKVNFCGVDLKIKIIANRHIDKDFGTGALGVTPAHSAVDWQMAQDNDLEIVKVINEQGVINKGFADFSEKNVLEARALVVKKLKKEKLIEKEEEFNNNLSVCERCRTAIEPLVSRQWFVNVNHKNFSLKQEAKKAIESEEIKIYPAKFKKVMLSWIDNVHDWCISRQIWWGPRIPAWYKDEEVKVSIDSPGKGWTQDEDTFDTWFSSGQWAYTTLGFPAGNDFKEYYPGNTMVMGRDILPFWAFRMIILSLYRIKQAPFKNLYFTGLIRDEKGQKMSKSKGNGIEPLDMIKRYGTDAVRLSLMIGSSPGNDMNLGEEKIAGYRNMVNKLWNVARYILQTIDDSKQNIEIDFNKLSLADRSILQAMRELVENITKDIAEYRFSQAGEKLRIFTWSDLADEYLEATKFDSSTQKEIVLQIVLKGLLKLWHPFIPFVTEVIWKQFNKTDLIIEKWPKMDVYNNILQKKDCVERYDFNMLMEVISSIRNARAENKVEPSRKVKAIVYANDKVDLIKENEALIRGMRTGIEELEVKESGKKPDKAIFVSVGEIEIYLIGAVDEEKEKKRLKDSIERLKQLIKMTESKLKDKNFVERAPESIVNKERIRLKEFKEEIKNLEDQLKSFI